MNVQPIHAAYFHSRNTAAHLKTQKTNFNNETKSPSFKGGSELNVADKIAGTAGGIALAVVTTAALGPVAGLLVGLLGGKAVAEANCESRPGD